MTLVRYNPLNDFVPSTFGDLIESVLRDNTKFNSAYKPVVDIFKSENEFEMHVYAPGLTKEDFNISLDKNILEISGERILSDELKAKLTKQESGYGKFRRSFTLSDNIDAANISANYADGILKVVLPLAEKKETKSIIKVK